MMKPILAFDTSLGECSVALMAEGTIVSEVKESERNRQTERLVPMIESALRQSGLKVADLGLIATTSGPGSFTGIRIGLATARGLALATAIPVIAVNTLELLAWQAHFFCASRAGESSPDSTAPPPRTCSDGSATSGSRTTLSLLNAYRGEAYAQAFAYNQKMQPLMAPCSLPLEDLPAFAAQFAPFLCAGDVGGDFTAHPAAQRPDAAALTRYAILHALTPADYPPQAVYIRPPDAKLPSNPLAPSCEAPLG